MLEKVRSAAAEDLHLMSPETKAFGTLMVIFNVCPKVKKNPSKVGNLVCKLWDSHATEGFYLLLLFLFFFFFPPTI